MENRMIHIYCGDGNGLYGVKAGQECYILFNGKYGFGNKPVGTVSANAALLYHIWVQSIQNQ